MLMMVFNFRTLLQTTAVVNHGLKLTSFRLFSTVAIKMQDTRPPGHSQLRIDHLKLMNYSMKVDEQKCEATIRTNGLHYTDFDSKNGMPKAWQLMKFLESVRFYCHHVPLDHTGRTFRDYAELTTDRLTFLVTSCFDIEYDMYDASKPKSPLLVEVKGGYVGTSSVNSIAKVLTEEGQLLLSNINQVVSIDKSSRRPMALPDWWREKYGETGKDVQQLKFHKFERPEGLTAFKVHVTRSDIDGNNHTNWSCYVRFALDGLYHNVKHKLIKNMDDLEKRGLKKMELLYSGESFDDDVLDVYVWPDTEDHTRVYAHIDKLNHFLFQGTFTFHEKPVF